MVTAQETCDYQVRSWKKGNLFYSLVKQNTIFLLFYFNTITIVLIGLNSLTRIVSYVRYKALTKSCNIIELLTNRLYAQQQNSVRTVNFQEFINLIDFYIDSDNAIFLSLFPYIQYMVLNSKSSELQQLENLAKSIFSRF